MKTLKTVFALAVCAGASLAVAAPRETFDLVAANGAPINSLTWQGTLGNPAVSVTALGSNGAGPYTAKSLTMTGTIGSTSGNSYFREACFLVTPPVGTPFIVQPINLGATGAGAPISDTVRVAIPGAITTAGLWSFQAFDYYDDVGAAAAGAGGVNGADAQWTALSVSFDDAPFVLPVGAGPHSTWNDVNSDGLAATPGASLTWNNATAGTFNGYRVSGSITALNSNGTTPANLLADLVSDLRIAVTPPGGALVTIQPLALNTRSGSTFEITIALTTPPVGAWGVTVFEVADLVGTVDNILPSLTLELVNVPAPAAEDLGTLASGVVKTDTETLAAGQTKWYKFTTTTRISLPLNNALEIDTVGSTAGATTGAGNTSMCLYDAVGVRVGADFVDGAGSLACLSFGNDNRAADPAVGADAVGLQYSGRDGAIPGGLLVPGAYYLAVTAGDTGIAYGPATWSVTNTSTVTGSVTTNILFKAVGVTPTNPAAPATETDLGTVVGGPGGAEAVTTFTVTTITAANQVKWIKYTTGRECSDATGFFLDIDTEGTTAGGLDTEIAAYHASGVFANEDDDDGNNLLSSLTFGDSAPARPIAGAGAPLARNGRDGVLPAETYYLAVGRFNFLMPFDNFGVTSSSVAVAGNIVVNFRTNLPSVCSVADVGVAGGTPGHDNRLDNNDFIIFINLFFAQDPAADVGVAGGTAGHDNAWDNNDFVMFINYFFNDTPNCTG